MFLRRVIHLLLVMLVAPAECLALDAFPVPVLVTQLETQPLPPLKPEVHEAAIKQTRAEMFAVAEQLRKQHGDKTSAWPPDVWKLFYVAEDAHTLAVARRDTKRPKRASASQIPRRISSAVPAANKAMTMVTSAEDASLVVQIIGRRRASASGPTDNRYFIRFRLGPGAQLTAARFLELTQGYKWDNLWTKVIAHPKDGSGYFELEAGSPASYKNCAGMVRAIVEWVHQGAAGSGQEE